jgi:hypothetical protein
MMLDQLFMLNSERNNLGIDRCTFSDKQRSQQLPLTNHGN